MYLPSDELGVEKKVRGYPVGGGEGEGGKGELSGTSLAVRTAQGFLRTGEGGTGLCGHRAAWPVPPFTPPHLDANAGIVPETLCLPCRSVPAPGSFPCPILTMLSLSRCNCLSLPPTTCAL